MNGQTLLVGLCDKVTSEKKRTLSICHNWEDVSTTVCSLAMSSGNRMSIIVEINVCSAAYKMFKSRNELLPHRRCYAKRHKGLTPLPPPPVPSRKKKRVEVGEKWQRTDFRVELFDVNESKRMITLPCRYVGKPIHYTLIFWPLVYTLYVKI